MNRVLVIFTLSNPISYEGIWLKHVTQNLGHCKRQMTGVKWTKTTTTTTKQKQTKNCKGWNVAPSKYAVDMHLNLHVGPQQPEQSLSLKL